MYLIIILGVISILLLFHSVIGYSKLLSSYLCSKKWKCQCQSMTPHRSSLHLFDAHKGYLPWENHICWSLVCPAWPHFYYYTVEYDGNLKKITRQRWDRVSLVKVYMSSLIHFKWCVSICSSLCHLVCLVICALWLPFRCHRISYTLYEGDKWRFSGG